MLDEHFPNSLIARYYGVNVVHSNGDVWRRLRRICNPAFKSLPIHFFIETGFKLMDILEKIDNKPIEVRNLMHRFALDVLGKAAFGFDFDNLGKPNNVYVTAYNKVQEDIRNPYFIYFPILNCIPFLNKQRFKRVEELDNILDEIVEKKREALANENTPKRGDLLELMLKACEDPENQKLTNVEFRHNLGVFMLAGHDTTANSLATVLYLLAAHKDVQRKAREEILRVLGDNLTPSMEQQKSLKYLDMILYENLRLYPPIAILPARVTTKDIECRGHVIPAGACIQLFIYGIHHSPELWKNPEEFLPERFENEQHEQGEFGSWLGFGGGSRMCLGHNFSFIEQRIVLCLLLRKYEISLTPNSIHKNGLKIDVAYSGTMSPLPIELIFKRRSE
ncbi:2178_t:CDS:10 [Cetraspora pellucida]|uniref:2178_t:CDS:1 n=1 Tax=Cetraspora pellucida TaxID=1433469 RepID=A0A9N9BJ92_9GLOM|nr:2178_t:CDS:10 [Cetraspora pellucida]